MALIVNTLSRDEITNLRGLIGATFDSLAGAHLPDYLSGSEVLLVTDRGVLRIWSEVMGLDFQGFDEDYSTLHVAIGDDGLDEATRLGHRYYFHSGERIDDVEIVREIVSEVVIGEATWEYCSDIAIMLKLSGGSLTLRREHLNMEVLSVRFADVGAVTGVPTPTSYWSDTVDTRYVTERIVLPVDVLLREAD
jgi:hypothetical protein